MSMQIYAPTGEPSPEVPTPLRRYINRHSQAGVPTVTSHEQQEHEQASCGTPGVCLYLINAMWKAACYLYSSAHI